MRKLTKKEKILYTIFKMYNKKSSFLKYEDILVNVFKNFPEDFQIRFYPEYPDTDTIRRALYQLIPEGYIRISNRNCTLTKEGKNKSSAIANFIDGNIIKIDGRRDLNYNLEIKRLLNLEGFIMYLKGQMNKIIDQDFYEFYRASVRTKNLELLGKIHQMNILIDRVAEKNKNISKQLKEYSKFLQKKFTVLFNEEK